jgi:hypothetical protein
LVYRRSAFCHNFGDEMTFKLVWDREETKEYPPMQLESGEYFQDRNVILYEYYAFDGHFYLKDYRSFDENKT